MQYAEHISSIFKFFGLSSYDFFFSSWSFFKLMTLITYNFLHGSILHLLANLWVLYVIGGVVERQIGSFRYILLFLWGGIFAGLVVSLFNLSNQGIFIGASASVSAVLGVFLVSNVSARLFVMVPILIIPYFLEVRSYIFVGVWLLIQFLFGLIKSFNSGFFMPDTEYWSHVAGFSAGLLFCSNFIYSHIHSRGKKTSPV